MTPKWEDVVALAESLAIDARVFTFDGGQTVILSSPYGVKRLTAQWGDEPDAIGRAHRYLTNLKESRS